MSRKVGLKPSKFSSTLAAVVGGGMTVGGTVMLVLTGHPILVVWTLIAFAITGYHVVNLLGGRAPPLEEIHFGPDDAPPAVVSTADRLRELERLRGAGLINDEESARKRAEILREL